MLALRSHRTADVKANAKRDNTGQPEPDRFRSCTVSIRANTARIRLNGFALNGPRDLHDLVRLPPVAHFAQELDVSLGIAAAL